MAEVLVAAVKPKKRSLEQFAREELKRGGKPCWTCHALPLAVRQEIESARLRDRGLYTLGVLVGYLKEQGYKDATENKLYKHFASHTANVA